MLGKLSTMKHLVEQGLENEAKKRVGGVLRRHNGEPVEFPSQRHEKNADVLTVFMLSDAW
jgi:hypothetical protein